MTIVTFNGQTSISPKFGILSWTKIVRPALPDTRDRLLTVPGRGGVWDMGHDRAELTIPCEFVVKADSHELLQQRIRAIAAWLGIDGVRELTFSDEPGIRYMARPAGLVTADKVAGTKVCACRANFLVPFGYAESISPTIITGSSGSYSGTLPAPMVITLTAAATPGDSLTITQGQYSSPAPFIRLLDQGFEGGEVVIIDTEKRLVTVDGADARPDVDIDSDFENFVLLPGAFVISAEGGVVESIVYRERYI